MSFADARHYARYALQGSRAIPDRSVHNTVTEAIREYSNIPVTFDHLNSFVERFKDWLGIPVLDHFDADFSSGTTQAFDSFYFRHRYKKFRCYIGEYFYHLKNWESNNVEWSFITKENPLTQGDALVLSYPFCDTGNFYNIDVLEECCSKNIPVLLDMCYYPLTNNDCDSDFNYKCIDTIAFSLSKVFPVANYRIGIRYTNKNVNDGQKLHHSINYNNMLSAFIGLRLIDKYSVSHIYDMYKHKQKDICNFFNLIPSDSVLFGIGDENWDIYSRRNLLSVYQLTYDTSMFCNRICLNSIYEHWNLYERFKNVYPT